MNFFENAPIWQFVPFYFVLVWSLAWKGIALWKAAKYDQRNWFIIILIAIIVNTFGLLEIVYLFRFAKRRMTIDDVKNQIQKMLFPKKAKAKSSK